MFVASPILANSVSKLNSKSKRQAIGGACLVLWTMLAAVSLAQGQTPVVTWHYDNGRTGVNNNETYLTPANVSSSTFGHLASRPVDGEIVGQALYLPAVNIPDKGVHNVIYVATNHDSVYAFDAEDATGDNANPLWMTSILTYSGPGATPAPILQTGGSQTGMIEHGIISTPVIDPATMILYAVAETWENGLAVHRLHALDATTGAEVLGGPATITASYTVNGVTATFQPLHQMNRPALLLVNGHVYIGFGGTYASQGTEQGWVMSYNATTLQQEGVWASDVAGCCASVWLRGGGLAADSDGHIYSETGEGPFHLGLRYPVSVQKFTQNGSTLSFDDWFTPWNYAYLDKYDQDMADGLLVLPDQPGQQQHELIAAGKAPIAYVLNRDNMGHLCTDCNGSDPQIMQEVPLSGVETGFPVYWNGTVYFTPYNSPIQTFGLLNGVLSPSPNNSVSMSGGGHAFITTNGGSGTGILWTTNLASIWALDAGTLATLYNTSQNKTRDNPPPMPHFPMPIVANGRLYATTMNSVEVYGLLPALHVGSGNGQTGVVGTRLPVKLQVTLTDPYTGAALAGDSVAFSDGGKGGSFSSVVQNPPGTFTTSYILPTKPQTITIMATGPKYAPIAFTETAVPNVPAAFAAVSGTHQTAPVLTALPKPVVYLVKDIYGNGVPGLSVGFADTGVGSTFAPNPIVTDNTGHFSVAYTTGTKAGNITITATAASGLQTTFTEAVTAAPAASVNVFSGNNQSAAELARFGHALVVKVTDQYGNPINKAPVTFDDGGAGGSFSLNPVPTNTQGLASVLYTAGPNSGAVSVTASTGAATPAVFTETVKP